MKKTFWKWILFKEGECTGEKEIVRVGIVDTPIEIDVEHVFPDFDYCGDRNLCDMQEFADNNSRLAKRKYTFEYKEIEIDFSDLE